MRILLIFFWLTLASTLVHAEKQNTCHQLFFTQTKESSHRDGLFFNNNPRIPIQYSYAYTNKQNKPIYLFTFTDDIYENWKYYLQIFKQNLAIPIDKNYSSEKNFVKTLMSFPHLENPYDLDLIQMYQSRSLPEEDQVLLEEFLVLNALRLAALSVIKSVYNSLHESNEAHNIENHVYYILMSSLKYLKTKCIQGFAFDKSDSLGLCVKGYKQIFFREYNRLKRKKSVETSLEGWAEKFDRDASYILDSFTQDTETTSPAFEPFPISFEERKNTLYQLLEEFINSKKIQYMLMHSKKFKDSPEVLRQFLLDSIFYPAFTEENLSPERKKELADHYNYHPKKYSETVLIYKREFLDFIQKHHPELLEKTIN